jgi:hypothetical protein
MGTSWEICNSIDLKSIAMKIQAWFSIAGGVGCNHCYAKLYFRGGPISNWALGGIPLRTSQNVQELDFYGIYFVGGASSELVSVLRENSTIHSLNACDSNLTDAQVAVLVVVGASKPSLKKLLLERHHGEE